MATKKYMSGGAKKYQLGGIAKAGKKIMRKAGKKVTKMMEGRTGTKAPTKSKVKKMAKKGKLGTGLAKAQKGGTMKAPKLRGRTITSPSGLTQRVTRKGAVKKNQGGGRPMSAKKIVKKISRSRKKGNNSPKSL